MKDPTVDQCKKRLATLWFGIAAFAFAVVFLQSLMGHYGEDSERAWAWLTPQLLPTLSLIVGVLVADLRTSHSSARHVSSFTFRLSMCVSAFYLVALVVTLLAQPIVVPSWEAVSYLERSSRLLTPFQGLALASLGAFFAKIEARPIDQVEVPEAIRRPS